MRPPRWGQVEWDAASLVLLHRDSGRCLWCEKSLNNDGARHHRMRRREGGDRLANLLVLHTRCHTDIHGHPLDAKERGFIVPTWEDVLTVPVWTRRGGWLLDDEGTKVLIAA